MRAKSITPAKDNRIYKVILTTLATVASISLIFLSSSANARSAETGVKQGQQASLSEPTSRYCNLALVTIRSVGVAAPYPSKLGVSGLQGTITHVSVTLNRLRHDFYDDMDILLVGPTGQSVLLMSDVGDSCNRETTLTFEDNAPSLPDVGCPFFSDSYRASNYQPEPDTFPSPAPAPPYGGNLSVFNGTNPNGTWALYVVDDYGLFEGRISGGWCLDLTVAASR